LTAQTLAKSKGRVNKRKFLGQGEHLKQLAPVDRQRERTPNRGVAKQRMLVVPKNRPRWTRAATGTLVVVIRAESRISQGPGDPQRGPRNEIDIPAQQVRQPGGGGELEHDPLDSGLSLVVRRVRLELHHRPGHVVEEAEGTVPHRVPPEVPAGKLLRVEILQQMLRVVDGPELVSVRVWVANPDR
jgi:hypothetical protein